MDEKTYWRMLDNLEVSDSYQFRTGQERAEQHTATTPPSPTSCHQHAYGRGLSCVHCGDQLTGDDL